MRNAYINFAWYDLWMQQSKLFFETAQDKLQELFQKNYVNPKDHEESIKQWSDILKEQWRIASEKFTANNINEFNEFYYDALDEALKLWQAKFDENKPIKNVTDLYELWLTACKQAYLNAGEDGFKNMAQDWNAAAHEFWQNVWPKA